MSRHITWAFFASSCTLLTLACYAPTTHAGGWGVFTPPTTNMEKLACHIDKLEKHIDEYGSVVAKAPDVWGEERLTQHRFEYETILSKELNNFQARINANVLRSDEAFLATAVSIAASMDAAPNVRSRAFVGSTTVDVNNAESNASTNSVAGFAQHSFSETLKNVADNKLEASNLEPTIHLDQLSRYINHLHELRRINEGDDIAANPGYQIGLLRVPVSINPGKTTREGYGAEITFTVTPQIGDAMLNTYFETLVVNDLVTSFEGVLTDSLNKENLFVKNKETNISEFDSLELFYKTIMKAKISLGEAKWIYQNIDIDNLTSSTSPSSTLKDFVQSAVSILETDDKYKDFYKKITQQIIDQSEEIFNEETAVTTDALIPYLQKYGIPEEKAQRFLKENLIPLLNEDDLSTVYDNAESFFGIDIPANLRSTIDPVIKSQRTEIRATINDINEKLYSDDYKLLNFLNSHTHSTPPSNNQQGKPTKPTPISIAGYLFNELVPGLLIGTGGSAGRGYSLPLSLSDFSTVYGPTALIVATMEAAARVERHRVFDKDFIGIAHAQDVENYLRQEIASAYHLLKQTQNADLWQHCGDGLASAIRTNNQQDIINRRIQFFCDLQMKGVNFYEGSDAITAIYAWAIICEAALLNERLIEDMRTLTSTKGCCCLGPSDWHAFYLPNPDPVACEVFRQYVNCRWPIHVFHVDPQEQQQNVNDSFTGSRELQLSLAIALSQGRISFSQASQFARRIQLEVDTIALNKTAVGFTHGSDTFGFRFYPRVQTPDIESNIRVGMRDLIIGGPSKDALLKQHRIEPGPRECIALVVVPGFMRQMTVDVHSEWFKLTNPKHTVMSTKETVRLSKDITTLRELSTNCVKDQHLYRDGEVYRLMKRVDQLDHELPLQTMTTEMPVAEPLGGFRVFVPSGNFNRAPQLFSWNGVPGVDTTKSTSLFLVGENFRLRGTQVIAGNNLLSPNQTSTIAQAKRDLADTENKEVAEAAQAKVDAEEKSSPPGNTLDDLAVRLISDTILQVTIPKDANTFQKTLPSGATGTFIDVHVASYYGVSQHLHIPVIKTAQTEAKAAQAAADAAKAEVAKALVASGISYKWKQDDPINATYCTNNSALSINFSNIDIDPTSTRQIISNSPQSSIFDPTPEPQLAVIVTGLDADGKAIPGQQWTYTPEFVHDSAAQSGPIAFELSVSVPGAPGSPLTLTLPTRKILQNIQASLAGSVLTPQAPAALHLQGYLRFGGDGAPIMALTNNLLIKLSPINCAPPCIPGTTSNLNSLFTPVATSPPQPPLPLANTPQPKPSLADRYRVPQQATITPPLIAQ